MAFVLFLGTCVALVACRKKIQQCLWARKQRNDAKKVAETDYPGIAFWRIPAVTHVAGVDVTFVPGTNKAVASLVVTTYPGCKPVWQASVKTDMQEPYASGFLACCEGPVLKQLVNDAMEDARSNRWPIPEIILVDGNGILHTRRFGIACYLGLATGIPTVGVATRLCHVDGLVKRVVKFDAATSAIKRALLVSNKDGKILGVAGCFAKKTTNPIYVSVGHNISLETATAVVEACCKYRVPEPVRLAKKLSRKETKLLSVFDNAWRMSLANATDTKNAGTS